MLLAGSLLSFLVGTAVSQDGQSESNVQRSEATPLKEDDRKFTLSGYLDGGYHQTQFFEDHHDAAVLTWDLRAEYWLSPKEFDWGPYLRVAGIVASKDQAWENSWQAVPGLGFQLYPFSYVKDQTTGGKDPTTAASDPIKDIFGPLRLFGEFNVQDFWGAGNSWRPDHQWRAGFDYWKAINSNDLSQWWWVDTWHGLIWQSADENGNHSVVLGDSVRAGVRLTHDQSPALSWITPYVVVNSSLSSRNTDYWNNRLDVGGGIRISPPVNRSSKWVNYVSIYAEYVYAAAYYHGTPVPGTPDHEIRAGITIGLGKWFH